MSSICEHCGVERSVVQIHNRALRRVNRLLRRSLETIKDHADEVFTALCETNPTADQAMRKLWEEGGFQPPCGPEDYDEIVNTAIRALQQYRSAAVEEAAYRDPEAAE